LAQTNAGDLRLLIQAGDVSLVSARGNGSSSGASVDGVLRNGTADTIFVDINFTTPLYFRNRGAGQNMLAVQVFLDDGAYLSDGSSFFIPLAPQEDVPVIFIAFCVDFHKENPAASESFGNTQLPENLRAIATKIAQYVASNPFEDSTIAGQIALWLSQGVALDSIRSKFPFSQADVTLATQILR
jgi:hypothetical protein